MWCSFSADGFDDREILAWSGLSVRRGRLHELLLSITVWKQRHTIRRWSDWHRSWNMWREPDDCNRGHISPLWTKWIDHLWTDGAKTQLCQWPHHHDGKHTITKCVFHLFNKWNYLKRCAQICCDSKWLPGCKSVDLEVLLKVWSITYNNWLTFALLVWSCIIWMMRDRRRYAMMSAPFLAVYGTVLVVLGFLSGLRLTREELYPGLPPTVIVDFDLNSYHPVPCIHLGAKVSIN